MRLRGTLSAVVDLSDKGACRELVMCLAQEHMKSIQLWTHRSHTNSCDKEYGK